MISQAVSRSERHRNAQIVPNEGTLDIRRAKDLLDYEPQYSFRQGLESYYDWIRQYTGKI